jgi:hypothetical protein
VSTQRTVALVWTTRILATAALPCPVFDILRQLFWNGPIRMPQPNSGSLLAMLLRVVLGWIASYCFLLWASGKIVCAVLATLTIIVAMRRGIDQRTRALTVAAGSATCCLLLWWVNIVKHQ